MATYDTGTSTAGEVLDSVQPVVSAFLANQEQDFTALSMCGQIGVECPVTLYWELEDGIVTTGQSDGRRLSGDDEPKAAGGSIETLRLERYEWGEEVILDPKLDATLKGQDVDEVGAMRSAAKLRSIVERHVSSLLDSSTDPWSASEQTASAAWTTKSTDIMGQLVDLMTTFDEENTLVSHRPNAIRLSRKSYLNACRNTAMVAQFGGNTGAGILTPEQAAGAFRSIGIDYVFVAPTALATSYLNMFYYAPDPRLAPSAVVLAHEGPMGSTSRTMHGHSRLGYYTSFVGDIGLSTKLGIRLKTLYS